MSGSNKERLLALIGGTGGERALVAPLTDVGFCLTTLGKTADLRLPEDEIETAAICGYQPIIECPLTLEQYCPPLQTTKEIEETSGAGGVVRERRILQTPLGPRGWTVEIDPETGAEMAKGYPVRDEKDYEILDWFAEVLQKESDIAGYQRALGEFVAKVDGRGLVSVFCVPPVELQWYISREDVFFHMVDFPETFSRAVDIMTELTIFKANVILDAGADMIRFGTPGGTEWVSPGFFARYVVPQSRAICRAVTKLGGLSNFHCCGHVWDFIKSGYFNEIGMDLLDTVTQYPVGNIPDLHEARDLLDERIVTRGNIGLDILLSGSTEDVARETRRILHDVSGFRHLISGSDTLYPGTPVENVRAMVDVVAGEGVR